MTGVIFFVLNAAGQIPLFLALLAKFPHERQLKIIAREMIIALILLLLFVFFGDQILVLLGISRPIIGMAGGILLFIISLSMIFPGPSKEEQALHQEPMIIPLAIPAITGPGAITTVMVLSQDAGSPFPVALAVLLAWIPSLIIVLAGSFVKRLVGEKGLIAIERLGGMIVCLIGVNMFAVQTLELIARFYSIDR